MFYLWKHAVMRVVAMFLEILGLGEDLEEHSIRTCGS